jgi:hypothetical protein
MAAPLVIAEPGTLSDRDPANRRSTDDAATGAAVRQHDDPTVPASPPRRRAVNVPTNDSATDHGDADAGQN